MLVDLDVMFYESYVVSAGIQVINEFCFWLKMLCRGISIDSRCRRQQLDVIVVSIWVSLNLMLCGFAVHA